MHILRRGRSTGDVSTAATGVGAPSARVDISDGCIVVHAGGSGPHEGVRRETISINHTVRFIQQLKQTSINKNFVKNT